MTVQPLLEYFETYLPFNKEEKDLIVNRVTRRKVKSREKILQVGHVCRHYTFVVKGCFRMYAMDQEGKEHNVLFVAENEWISDISSFHSVKPSKSNIQALEISEIIQIEQQDLYFLYLNILKLNRIFRVITENNYVELQNRIFLNISSSAPQRYLAFLEQYPKLANRLPSTQIAAYIGCTPEFLSKIRKDIALQ